MPCTPFSLAGRTTDASFDERSATIPSGSAIYVCGQLEGLEPLTRAGYTVYTQRDVLAPATMAMWENHASMRALFDVAVSTRAHLFIAAQGNFDRAVRSLRNLHGRPTVRAHQVYYSSGAETLKLRLARAVRSELKQQHMPQIGQAGTSEINGPNIHPFADPVPIIEACGSRLEPALSVAKAEMDASTVAPTGGALALRLGSPPSPPCGFQRAVALSRSLLPSLSPLPNVSLLKDRPAKLAHVKDLLWTRPNYLASLLANGLSPPMTSMSGGPRRIYLNLGARGVGDASTLLFHGYPGAPGGWVHHHFEADAKFTEQWRAAAAKDPRLHFHNNAVWHKDTTLAFGIRKSASHVVEGAGGSIGVFGQDRKITEEHQVVAIDLARWLQEHTAPDDFVLVKMDIEGAELAQTLEPMPIAVP